MHRRFAATGYAVPRIRVNIVDYIRIRELAQFRRNIVMAQNDGVWQSGEKNLTPKSSANQIVNYRHLEVY